MIPSTFEPIAAICAQGKVAYTPRLAAASCGFGPLEVHPNKVPFKRDGSVGLELNGEYLVVWGSSERERFACCGIDENIGALECAEIAAALNNGDKPTRVVDACGAEYTSRYTAAFLAKRAAERGVDVPRMPDLDEALAART
jgi:hypothetical protein